MPDPISILSAIHLPGSEDYGASHRQEPTVSGRARNPHPSIEMLFHIAGFSMFGHLVLSQLVRRRIGWDSDLACELFAVPNAAIASDWGFRLLRLKYWRFWRPVPAELQTEDALTRTLLVLAQFTGITMSAAMLAFFMTPFVQTAFLP